MCVINGFICIFEKERKKYIAALYFGLRMLFRLFCSTLATSWSIL